ncbi:inter-alpha-trypsin inhibitor heavy chain H3 [Apiospora rasikravindrae]|uniref:Inter-alpha-trypsin inhibitor heavy chain H3 n=1 Tax=Apiospora rasikravindrae TaxID=990691 RepID=A0ABR1SEB6_9PEZI
MEISAKRGRLDEPLERRPTKIQTKASESRTATMQSDPDAKPEVTLHPLASQDGVLVKVNPPKGPTQLKTAHVPCDIVLVIDVSGSMRALAPATETDAAGNERDENTGCTVLDIVKHAALTIMHTLDEHDRLGLVTFSSGVKVLQQLLPMTEANKKQTDRVICGLATEGGTNLWRGLQRGLQLFDAESDSGKVPALMLLTDGEPNQGPILSDLGDKSDTSTSHPREGYAQALRARGSMPTSIYAFGFGEDIMSSLLSEIADVGTGYYGFIPNSNMVCTVMVNAVAHLQSTFAIKCCLDIEVVQVEKLELSTGLAMGMTRGNHPNGRHWSVPLGNIQYGQSRDIYLRFNQKANKNCMINTQLTYSDGTGAKSVEGPNDVPVTQAVTLSDDEIAYHRNRDLVCRLVIRLCLRGTEDYIGGFDELGKRDRKSWYGLLTEKNTAGSHNDEQNRSLNQDVEGRIKQAVHSGDGEWNSWGKHYLLSLWAAHAKQLRTTFLDPGVQLYDAGSPLFLQCQARLMKAFEEEVVPPRPSRAAEADPEYVSGSKTLSMQSYSGRTLQYSNNPYSTSKSRGIQQDYDFLDDFP